jgi:hypothetical protein
MGAQAREELRAETQPLTEQPSSEGLDGQQAPHPGLWLSWRVPLPGCIAGGAGRLDEVGRPSFRSMAVDSGTSSVHSTAAPRIEACRSSSA